MKTYEDIDIRPCNKSKLTADYQTEDTLNINENEHELVENDKPDDDDG